MKKLFAILVLVGSFAFAPSAQATHFAVNGGIGFGSGDGANNLKNPSPLLGGSMGFSVGFGMEVGGFFDHYFHSVDPTGSASTNFYGALVRWNFPAAMGFFVDAKLGLSQASNADSAFSFGIGAGTKLPIAPTLDLAPNVGFASLPVENNGASAGRTYFNIGLALVLNLIP